MGRQVGNGAAAAGRVDESSRETALGFIKLKEGDRCLPASVQSALWLKLSDLLCAVVVS
jgi:hypothetical protein